MAEDEVSHIWFIMFRLGFIKKLQADLNPQ